MKKENLKIVRLPNLGRWQIANPLCIKRLKDWGLEFEIVGKVIRDYKKKDPMYCSLSFRYVDLDNGQTFTVFHDEGAKLV